MPDRTSLKIGDSIKIVSVPTEDLVRRVEDLSDKPPVGIQIYDILPTATVIEYIIEQCPVVIINDIEQKAGEYYQPWFSVNLKIENDIQHHTLAVMDDESWELVHRSGSPQKPPIEHLIAQLNQQIHMVLDQYSDEYQHLAEQSEALYDEEPSMDQELSTDLIERKLELEAAYQELDKQTGLNALFSTLAEYKKAQR